MRGARSDPRVVLGAGVVVPAVVHVLSEYHLARYRLGELAAPQGWPEPGFFVEEAKKFEPTTRLLFFISDCQNFGKHILWNFTEVRRSLRGTAHV